MEETEFNAPEAPDPLGAPDMENTQDAQDAQDAQSLGKAFDYQQTCT